MELERMEEDRVGARGWILEQNGQRWRSIELEQDGVEAERRKIEMEEHGVVVGWRRGVRSWIRMGLQEYGVGSEQRKIEMEQNGVESNGGIWSWSSMELQEDGV